MKGSDDTTNFPEADTIDNGAFQRMIKMLGTPNLWTQVGDVDNSEDSNIVDTEGDDIDEAADVDATDKGVPSDDKTADLIPIL